MYDWKTDYYSNDLIFSEKHLCNELDFGDTFFTKEAITSTIRKQI